MSQAEPASCGCCGCSWLLKRKFQFYTGDIFLLSIVRFVCLYGATAILAVFFSPSWDRGAIVYGLSAGAAVILLWILSYGACFTVQCICCK